MGYKIVASLLKLNKVNTDDEFRRFQLVQQDFERNKIFFNSTPFLFNSEKPRESLHNTMSNAGITPVIMNYIAQEGHQDGFLHVASRALVGLIDENIYACRAEMKYCYFTTKKNGKVEYTEKAAVFIARHKEDVDVCLKSEASMDEIKKAKGNPEALLRVERRPMDEVYKKAQQDLEIILAGKAEASVILQAETDLENAIKSGQVSILKPLLVMEAGSTISAKKGKLTHTYHRPNIDIEPKLGVHLVENKLSFADKLFINIKNSVDSIVTRFNNWWGGRKQSVVAAPVQPAVISESLPEAVQVVEPVTPVLNA